MTKEDREGIEIVNWDKIIANRRTNPQAPWRIARELEANKAAEFITMQQVYDKLNVFDNPRDKALYVISYLCALRVEEIVRHTPVVYGKKEVYFIRKGKGKKMFIADHNNKRFLATKPSLKKEAIVYENFNGKKTLVFKVRNLKNKNAGENVKLIPLTLQDDLSLKFKAIIDTYISSLEDDEELFPICKRRAEQIIAKAGYNTHFLRKLRLTHLVRYYNFSDAKLKVFAGWSDSRPSKYYIRIGVKDLVTSMQDFYQDYQDTFQNKGS